jgi:hypothetical protein
VNEPQTIRALPLASLRAERGWTRKTVEALVGAPDLIVETPRGEKTTVFRFYKLERIEAAEATKAFKQKRRRTPKERIEAQRKQIRHRLLRRLAEFTVTINREDLETVRLNAHLFYGTRKEASFEQNAVEYLLVSGCVHYDRTLADDALGHGYPKIVRAARTKVLETIADAYPEFAAECTGRIIKQSSAMINRPAES